MRVLVSLSCLSHATVQNVSGVIGKPIVKEPGVDQYYMGVGKDSGQKLTDRCMREQSSRAHNNRLRN
jgi:hypothetical protein